MAWLEVDYFNNLGPIDSRITILLTVLGCLLLGALIVYLISAIRNRGKAKARTPRHRQPRRLGRLFRPRRRRRRSSQLQPRSLCALRTQKRWS